MSERVEVVPWFDPIAMSEPLVRQSDYLALREELVELRQAVWDARAIMGFDNDGDSTPDALKFPTLAVMVIADAKEMRDDYDAAIAELDALKARIAVRTGGTFDEQRNNRRDLSGALHACGCRESGMDG